MSDKLVIVYTTQGAGPAEIVRGALEAAGIPAELSQEGAGHAYGLTVGPLGTVNVLVSEARALEAEALIAALERGDMESEDDSIR